MTEKERKLKEAALPLIKLLSEEYHPHITAIVTATSVELVEGVTNIPHIFDFIDEPSFDDIPIKGKVVDKKA